MGQEKIENYLHELRENIEVDEEVKRKLRASFIKKEKNRRNSWLPLVAAAILFLAVLLPNLSTKQVRAGSLMVENGISFLILEVERLWRIRMLMAISIFR